MFQNIWSKSQVIDDRGREKEEEGGRELPSSNAHCSNAEERAAVSLRMDEAENHEKERSSLA